MYNIYLEMTGLHRGDTLCPVRVFVLHKSCKERQ